MKISFPQRMAALCLLTLIWLFPIVGQAQDTLPPLVKDLGNDSLTLTPVGVDRELQPFHAIVWQSPDYVASKRRHVMLVGRSEEAAQAIQGALRWFYASPPNDALEQLREQYSLSAVSHAPIADEHAVFPPAGSAYNDAQSPQAMSLWRWLGMQAPDLVVEVTAGDELGWYAAKDLADELPMGWKRLAGRKDELAAALPLHAPCNTGVIPALRLAVGDAEPAVWLAAPLQSLEAALKPSAARQEIARRTARTPQACAEELAQVYGHDLGSVVYIPALALVGRIRLGELTDDSTHIKDVRSIVAPYVDGTKPTKPNNGSALSGHLVFTELARRSEGAARERLLAVAHRASDLGLTEQGKPTDHMPYHSEMSDALFMGGPILAEVGALTGNGAYYQACMNHLRFMRKLDLREDGLYRHSPLDEAAWGRGNGFPALGLALCLSVWPRERSDREELLRMHADHLQALLPHQDGSGAWRQVIDQPGSYREFTCTCMITFAMARGVNRGWLKRDDYDAAIRRATTAIAARIGKQGELVDVCTGTGKQKDLAAYYHRTAILGRDARGGAMGLMATTELMEYFSSK